MYCDGKREGEAAAAARASDPGPGRSALSGAGGTAGAFFLRHQLLPGGPGLTAPAWGLAGACALRSAPSGDRAHAGEGGRGGGAHTQPRGLWRGPGARLGGCGRGQAGRKEGGSGGTGPGGWSAVR